MKEIWINIYFFILNSNKDYKEAEILWMIILGQLLYDKEVIVASCILYIAINAFEPKRF